MAEGKIVIQIDAAAQAQLDRIEKKLDTLIAALAEGEDADTSLDSGREFAPRDDRKGLG